MGAHVSPEASPVPTAPAGDRSTRAVLDGIANTGSVATVASTTVTGRVRKGGQFWELEFEGRSTPVRSSKGIVSIVRLLEAGGYVYVCGSQPMRDAVRAAFTDVIAEHGALPRERATAYLHELETTTRYRPDLWI